MIRHIIVCGNSKPREWDPRNPGPELPRDCVYFGKVLVEFEKHLTDNEEEIHCYMTWDKDSLPEYGPHVIAILVGDEVGLIPRYARHVRMVARVMSRYPFLGVRRWWPLNRLTLMLAIKHVRNWVMHLWSWVRCQLTPPSWPQRVRDKGFMVHLPWGSAPLLDVPVKKMSERTCNYFFFGSGKAGRPRISKAHRFSEKRIAKSHGRGRT